MADNTVNPAAIARAAEISRNHGSRIRRAHNGKHVGLADMKRLLIELGIVHRFDPDIHTIADHVSL